MTAHPTPDVPHQRDSFTRREVEQQRALQASILRETQMISELWTAERHLELGRVHGAVEALDQAALALQAAFASAPPKSLQGLAEAIRIVDGLARAKAAEEIPA